MRARDQDKAGPGLFTQNHTSLHAYTVEDILYSHILLQGLSNGGVYTAEVHIYMWKDGREAEVMWKNWNYYLKNNQL